MLEPVHNLPPVQKALLLATKLRLGLNVSRTRFGLRLVSRSKAGLFDLGTTRL